MASYFCNHAFQLEGVDYVGGSVADDLPAGSIEGALRCGHIRAATPDEIQADQNSRKAEAKAIAEAETREKKRLAAAAEDKKKHLAAAAEDKKKHLAAEVKKTGRK
ncbi:MAG: hypothetical protein ACE5KM_13770 [Planctomycetaceae bacterium]